MNREAENNRDYNDINAGAMSYENIMGIETQILPTVTLRGLSILPGMVIHFDLSRDRSIEAAVPFLLLFPFGPEIVNDTDDCRD